MRCINQGVLFDATVAPSHRRFCSFTSTLILSDGRILVPFRSGSSKDAADENVVIRMTSDGGNAWETVFDGLESSVEDRRGCWRSGYVTEREPGHLIGCFNWF